MKRFYLTIFSLSLLFSTLPQFLQAQTQPDHSIWHDILQKNVNLQNGTLNYKGVRSQQAALDRYLKELADHAPTSAWNSNQKMAYWMNAYNAFTVKLILDNYPLKSIMDLDKPWDKKFISLGGKTYSLNQIENEILRRYSPLVHFGINCASISCPKLHNEAFTGENVGRILTQLTRNFINDSKYNQTGSSNPKLSSIFDWYSKDFTNNGKSSVITFINRYASNQTDEGATLQYLDYNWSLNDWK